jgi:hypothetical protein
VEPQDPLEPCSGSKEGGTFIRWFLEERAMATFFMVQ